MVDLKEDLHRKIDSLDEHQLKEAYGVMTNYLNSRKDFWEELSDEEKAAIEIGLSQIQNGQTTPHEKVMAELRKSLDK